jgi:ATP/ADP translocase/HEAT repeat protein
MLRLADVRPEERRSLAAAFLTLLGILASHTVLETARDALFLARLPPSTLPWVYIAMAVVAVGIAQVPARGLRRLTGPYGLSLLLVSLATVTFGFWLFGGWRSSWMLRVLYVWTGLVGTLATLQFWLVLGEMYTITQAKRLYRLIGTGSLMGAVAGGALARTVSMHLPASQLILAAAVLMAATGLGPALMLRQSEGSTQSGASGARWTLGQAREILERQPYVTRLAILITVSTIAVTLADYVFKSSVARSVPASELGPFFATFYTVLNLLALLAQLFLMGWLLRTVGLHRTMWILPLLLLLGAVGALFGGGLAAALLLKGADGTLRPSLHRTGTELLFLPIPDALRSRVKPLIDVVGQRGGQALAAVLILSQLSMYGEVALAGAAVVLCVVWIAATADIRPHYVEMFRRALREGVIETSGELPELDLGSLEALFAALNSQDDAEVTGALELLADEGRVRLIPALVLYHPSPPVVLRALQLFETSGRSDFLPIADRLLRDGDAEVRAAALRARSAVQADETVLRAAMEDESPLVKATAVVGLLAGGWISDEAQATLDSLLASRAPEARLALARAIQQRPTTALLPVLMGLAYAPEPDVQAAAAHAMGSLKDEQCLPALLPMLGAHTTRPAARDALLAFGPPGLAFLDEALDDATLPHDVRRHVPRTISHYPARDAAPVLLKHLLPESDGMVRFKILRGLGRLAAANPDLPLDRGILRTATDRTLEAAFRLVHWRQVLEDGARSSPPRATRGHELLTAMLRDKEIHTSERLSRLLGLRYRGENFERIYRGLRNSNQRVRASSRELLENVIGPPLRDAVLALVDPVPGVDRLAAGASYYRASRLEYEALLGALLEQPGETLRCLAAFHVGELGLVTLRPRLEALRDQETGLYVFRVLERTLALLTPPPGGGLVHAS